LARLPVRPLSPLVSEIAISNFHGQTPPEAEPTGIPVLVLFRTFKVFVTQPKANLKHLI
jgi:hypothetical protein